MTFVIDAARPEDLPELTSVIFRSHEGKNHYVNCAYPDNLSPEGQTQALKKLQTTASAAEDSLWLKATDTYTGQIVGVAIWTTFITRKPTYTTSSKTNHEQGSRNEEYVKQLNASIVQTGAEFWETNALPLTSLLALAVAPEYQHKGIGTLLMKSGCEYADHIGSKTSVVSTDAAGGFYQKCGFRAERHIALEVSEEFSMEEKVWIYFLVRDRVHGIWNSFFECS